MSTNSINIFTCSALRPRKTNDAPQLLPEKAKNEKRNTDATRKAILGRKGERQLNSIDFLLIVIHCNVFDAQLPVDYNPYFSMRRYNDARVSPSSSAAFEMFPLCICNAFTIADFSTSSRLSV